jgi:hypothetical protein
VIFLALSDYLIPTLLDFNSRKFVAFPKIERKTKDLARGIETRKNKRRLGGWKLKGEHIAKFSNHQILIKFTLLGAVFDFFKAF